MSTPAPSPAINYTTVSYDGEKLELRWEAEPGDSHYAVEVKCPNWGSTYKTSVDSPSVMLGVSGNMVEYRVSVNGAMFPDFQSVDAPGMAPAPVPAPAATTTVSSASAADYTVGVEAAAATVTSFGAAATAPPLPPPPVCVAPSLGAAASAGPGADWIRSLGVDTLLTEALSPLASGYPSLALAMGALDEAAVAARLREADIAAQLAHIFVTAVAPVREAVASAAPTEAPPPEAPPPEVRPPPTEAVPAEVRPAPTELRPVLTEAAPAEVRSAPAPAELRLAAPADSVLAAAEVYRAEDVPAVA